MNTPKPGTIVSSSTKQIGKYRVTTQFVALSPAEATLRWNTILSILRENAARRIRMNN